MKKMKLAQKFASIGTILSIVLVSVILTLSCKKDKDDKTGLFVLAALLASGQRDMYGGFADIPASIYKSSASSASSSIRQTLATSDYKFKSGTSSVAGVFDLVKVTAKNTRDIAKSIGDLVKALEDLNVTVSSTALTGTSTWGEKPAKYSYKSSTKLSGGKLLEIWWNNAGGAYANNKAIEMNYTGSVASGSINGYLWVRFLSSATATTLSKAYINFEYKASTNTRTMVVIMQDIGPNYQDKAHFFVQEVSGTTKMDGGYTAYGFNPNATGVTAADRTYVFNAIGNSGKAVINAAFPLSSDNTSTVFSNTSLGNIGQVWTSFILANSSTVSTVNSLAGYGITSCGASYIAQTPNNGNPTSLLSTFSVANLKNCLDSLLAVAPTNSGAQGVYFLTNIKNPAYFTYTGSNASLYGVESLAANDALYTDFKALQDNLATAPRTTANTTYPASMDAASIASINLFTGVGIPTGSSATALTSLNAQWGNGTPFNGTSSSSAGTNSVNGSSDNTAPF
ncbi:MAG: hypothetical protein L6Q54_14225 [Leptospiraceae bacterium]|nr:hypothetical protein [Leptospiraceae bacterium]MCK6382392.1 hypothetical protein [Leptospiraceae bacterium]NUM42127.1 hypothetical protein [Leptospiraceae bacterium]